MHLKTEEPVFFLLRRRDLRPQRGVLGLQGSHSLARPLGLGPPLLAALGDGGDLVLEAFDLGLEVPVLTLPAIAALAEGPDQGPGSALVALTSRGGVGFRGVIHAPVLCRDGPKSP